MAATPPYREAFRILLDDAARSAVAEKMYADVEGTRGAICGAVLAASMHGWSRAELVAQVEAAYQACQLETALGSDGAGESTAAKPVKKKASTRRSRA